jgi:PAS domain S-box-containing protein
MSDLGASERLRAAFEISPAILTVTDVETGRILEVNEAFLHVTGYHRDEVIGRTVPEIGLWVDPAQRETGLATLRAGRGIRGIEARFRTKQGEEVWAVASAELVEIEGRRCV